MNQIVVIGPGYTVADIQVKAREKIRCYGDIACVGSPACSDGDRACHPGMIATVIGEHSCAIEPM